jgi:LCP family protein required for cell wall assembly
LVLGIDDVQGSKRSDTIIVLNLNKSRNRIGVLSIPRDAYIELPKYGYTKINHAYAFGGVQLVKDTVSRFLEIPIHHYVVLNMDGVRQMVDRIGGIEIDIKKRMYYVDHAGDLYIDFKPGYQKVGGKQAIEYLRYRQDLGSDLGRIQRQQEFVSAVADKMLSPLYVFRLPQIIRDLIRYVDTDLTTGQMFVMTMEMKDAFKKNHIQSSTLPGHDLMVKGASYIQIDPLEVAKVVQNTLWGIGTKDMLASTQLTTAFNGQKKSNLQYQAELERNDLSVKRSEIDRSVRRELERRYQDDILRRDRMWQNKLSVLVRNEGAKRRNLEQQVAEVKTIQIRLENDLSKRNSTLKDLQKRFENANMDREKLLRDQPTRKADQRIRDEMNREFETRLAAARAQWGKEHPPVQVVQKLAQDRAIKELQDKLAAAEQSKKRTHDKSPIFNEDTRLTVEILNGNGQVGLASQVGLELRNRGVIVPRTGEAAHHNYQNTVIVDWKGNSQEAVRLAQALGISPANIVTYYLPKKTLDLTVVLGKDWDSLK